MNTSELLNQVKSANGTRRNRIMTAANVAEFEEIFNARKDDPTCKSIRVYPDNPFVAHSYNGRADVTIIEANRDEEGNWQISVGTRDAHRSHGNGARITINGRAA